jgi:sugar phosphate isomerase/epimerase
MARRPITGTPQQRRAKREQRREENRVSHVRQRAAAARNGREVLVVACNAALAAGKRLTDDARRALARSIAELVEAADVPDNRRTREDWS